MADDRLHDPGVAFYLSQLGGHSSREWSRRLARDGLEAREVMLFRFVALADGHTQRQVARAIGLPASRIVGLVDRLEERGWIERRSGAADRRTRTLHVTPAGQAVLDVVRRVSAEHEAAMTRGISQTERAQLLDLLRRLAAEQGLASGVHPGFADAAADHRPITDPGLALPTPPSAGIDEDG